MKEKIWGTDEKAFENDNIEVHVLRIRKGYGCSLHDHRLKRNFFYVIDGELKIRHDLGESILNKGESLEIKPPNTHRFIAMADALVIEIVHIKMEDYRDDINRLKSGGKDVF